ncbi:XRE family transcriptional regulator [Staphylococcus gallinarum]|uniref:CI-like repressor, phage associated n=1 Tax=Staphylococcus gallinarum TaxID=1293 RepID=A0A0D0RL49_STAGA|nr:XRE family transcriptional regulator [Staphylococcus gallinarum]KIR10637.1 hypothetical protein SH09_10735 [Staphylococcus gallinarum]RTX78707.1 XRE family transcriptional regulator [Staphylococcus gallinarum]GEQ04520.1 transcriptional regulator [Staphylococcus gallinarum]SUM32067.1 CI-like repressor, phage associated [Staphylococcus gallinarum]
MNKERNRIIANNIRKYLKETEMTQKQLAELIDIKPSTLSDYLNLRSNPSHGVIQKIADVFGIVKSDIDTTYKEDNDITTVYNQLTPPRQENVLTYAEGQLKEQNKVTSIDDYKDVNINLYAAAGLGTMNFDKENLIEQVRMHVTEVPNEYDLVARVTGDSMYPFFRDGEIIFIKEQHYLTENMIGLVEINGEAFLKKMYKEDDRLVLESLNKDKNENGKALYPKFYADELDDVRIIGKAI